MWPTLWNLFHVTILAPRNWRWFLHFLKICGSLAHTVQTHISCSMPYFFTCTIQINTKSKDFALIGNFQTSKSLNIREREYRCLCSYYVINTYASLTLCSRATTKVVFPVTRFDPRSRLSSFSHAPFCECVCRQV
jgi:hypothetical protein